MLARSRFAREEFFACPSEKGSRAEPGRTFMGSRSTFVAASHRVDLSGLSFYERYVILK